MQKAAFRLLASARAQARKFEREATRTKEGMEGGGRSWRGALAFLRGCVAYSSLTPPPLPCASCPRIPSRESTRAPPTDGSAGAVWRPSPIDSHLPPLSAAPATLPRMTPSPRSAPPPVPPHDPLVPFPRTSPSTRLLSTHVPQRYPAHPRPADSGPAPRPHFGRTGGRRGGGAGRSSAHVRVCACAAGPSAAAPSPPRAGVCARVRVRACA